MPAAAMHESTPTADSPPAATPPAVDPARLWEDFGPPLRGFLARRVPPGVDADDLVQEVFLRVVRGVATLRGAARPEAWLFQIARNALRDALRARLRRDGRTDALEDDVPAAADASSDRAAETELAPCLTAMVARLPEPYRTAITLTSLQGTSQAEAARALGVSISGMKSRVQRGRVQLRRMLVACCAIAVDVRGGVSDFHLRDASGCAGPMPAAEARGCGAASRGPASSAAASMPRSRRLQRGGREQRGPLPRSPVMPDARPILALREETSRAATPGADACCGGPAPAGTDACCVRDADARTAGQGGCGCTTPASAPVATTRPRSACC